MTHARQTKIGNRIAPARFIVFALTFLVAGVVAYTVAPPAHADASSRIAQAVMEGFDIAAAIFLISLWPLLRDGDAASIRKHAGDNDANRTVLLGIAGVILVVLMVAIYTIVGGDSRPQPVLIIVTLTLAWLFANFLFTLHYAHLFYGAEKPGGLEFPGTKTPDYWDFAYFACGLGMTFQTADVNVVGRTMRRLALAHSLAAFGFNIGILAFTINVLSN